LSGKHITQQQRNLYMKYRQAGLNQTVSGAKSGISSRSGRRIEEQGSTAKKPHHWRTREDPFAQVWESELVPLLEQEPTLTGLTLWEHLEESYPQHYSQSQLRTLQRRVKHWRATRGPDKPVMFRQSVPPGHQGLSDFTHPNIAVTIAGQPFKHLIYQFRLAFSGWRYAHIVQGGESYSALAEGLQNALHKMGGVPFEHRTDSLSAAYVNQHEQKQLTLSYEGLCEHYGMTGTTNNLGISHENGAIETAHASLKHRLDQAFKLRGNTDFVSIADYQAFIDRSIARLNQLTKTRFLVEQAQLQPLPAYRFMDYSELCVKVTTSSTISVKRGLYTVPSRLIGETLRLHLYHDKLIGFVGQTQALLLTRVYAQKPSSRVRCIDYRHVIHSLAAKPQAFRFCKFRDELFPDDNYRQLWQRVDQQLSSRDACKWMVVVLRIAATHPCEKTFGMTLLQQANADTLPDIKTLQARYLNTRSQPKAATKQHDISDYDQFLPIHKIKAQQAQETNTCH